MAIPSGSGSEILKVKIEDNVTNETVILITGVADHIYTILSIIMHNNTATTKNHALKVEDDNNGTDSEICNENIDSWGTFIWNDKFVLSGTDQLKLTVPSGADTNVVCSYIDQDWT